MYFPNAVSAAHCEASVRAPTSVSSGQLAWSCVTTSGIDGVVRTVVRSLALSVYFLLSPCGSTVVLGGGGGVPFAAAGPGATGSGGGLPDIVNDASGGVAESAGEEFPSDAV